MANLVELFDNIVQMQNLNGVPLAYGKMYVYALGRTRLMDTWSDVDGSSLNTNPVILDNAGQCHCFVNDAFDYTIVVCDAYDNEIFSLDKYLYSDGSHSHADVAMAPSESIAVSSYHVGETTVYVPYLTGEIGKVYTGIEPVNVDNVNDTISVSHVGLGLQEPLYFVEDSETACIIGCSAQTEIPSATSGKWEDAADTVIANSAQWGEDTTYEAGSYVDITDNTISVTGLQPSGDYADSSALDTKLDTTVFSDVSGSFLQSADLEGYATESFVNDAVDSAVSGKLDSATYAAQSGDFYLTSNPDGYITGVPSSYLQNSDLTIVDNKITEISGIELSAGDEFPQSATEAIEVVTANSGDWNNVTAKLDKSDSGNFYPMESNPAGYLTTETDWTDTITAASSYAYEQSTAAIPAPFDPTYLSGQIDTKLDSAIYAADSGNFLTELPSDLVYTADIQDMATTGDLTGKQDITGMTAYATVESLTAKQDAGNYLSASDSANFLLTSDSGNFLTAHQELPESANWNSTYNTVHDNSASWTGGGASYTGDAQGALDEVYSNSANWNETYSAVSSNSADWNTVIDVSAGSGIVFNKVNNVVYIEADIRTGSI